MLELSMFELLFFPRLRLDPFVKRPLLIDPPFNLKNAPLILDFADDICLATFAAMFGAQIVCQM